LKITKLALTYFWATYFFHSEGMPVIFLQNVFGYILGDFFTNSSGHPEPNPNGF
jgi:hypothetical protein